MKNKIEIDQVVNYSTPGLKMVESTRTATGKVIRFGKVLGGNRQVLVEDTEIQKGESKIYQHWIGEDQIQNHCKHPNRYRHDLGDHEWIIRCDDCGMSW